MVNVINLTTSKVDESFLVKIGRIVLDKEQAPENSEVSIVISGENFIKNLNYKYRGKNRSTDALSFSVRESNDMPRNNTEIDDLGEIVVCLSEVKKNAKRDDVALEKELAMVVIHGILHLLGYDHEGTEEQARLMGEKEDKYFGEVI